MRAGSKTFGTGMPALLVRFATGGSAAPGTHLVRYGSKAEKLKTSTSRPLYPRKRTNSGHPGCPLRANRGLTHRSKKTPLFDRLDGAGERVGGRRGASAATRRACAGGAA